MLTIQMLKLITSAQGVEVEVCALAMNGQNVYDMVTEDVTPGLGTCRRAVFSLRCGLPTSIEKMPWAAAT